MAVDSNNMNEFLGRFVNDLGASVHAGMVVIGDRLGLYKALAQGPMTAAELAKKTNTDERYVREWAASPAAGRYLTYEPGTQRFGMTEEQVPWRGRMVRRFCQAHSNLRLDRSRRSHGSPRRFGQEPEWDGSNMKRAFSMDVRNSSAPATPRIWSRRGSHLSKELITSSLAERRLPTSDAARELLRF
jgi:hypothetical protein